MESWALINIITVCYHMPTNTRRRTSPNREGVPKRQIFISVRIGMISSLARYREGSSRFPLNGEEGGEVGQGRSDAAMMP